MEDFLDDVNAGQGRCACLGCCGCSLVLLIFLTSFTVVPVGAVGVVAVLGKVQEKPYTPGWYFVTPGVSTVTLMSTRLHALHFADDVPTSEGVTVHLEASCINSLDPSRAVELFQSVGTDFENKVLLPEFQSVVRSVTSGHTSQSLYTAKSRAAMSTDLKSNLTALVQPRGILVHATLINKLQLPAKIEQSIEQKMAKEQQAEQMEFVLQKQRKIQQQQSIQAEGIAMYQRIISLGVNERMLRWKGIETTKQLVDTCNPKLIVIGGSSGQSMPIILQQGMADSPAPAPPSAGYAVDAAGKAETMPQPQPRPQRWGGDEGRKGQHHKLRWP
eukprot:TRINITY_DN24901_c0_g1_i1.p1 TRINITY_DN24901_c0_g1~~TRINITY_DN24901_c0_g1_i1.p1  ORF type:complete len:330 (+),score=106.15 TRINITY_DN24901_c0_g1_i1:104-1093(+)